MTEQGAKRRRTAAQIALASALLIPTGIVHAEEPAVVPAPVTVSAASSYGIADHISIQVKGIYNESNSEGVRLGAAIKVINTGEDIKRIPDHELRVQTTDGVIYTLDPSASNPSGIQPQSEADLIYYKTVQKKDDVSLAELFIVDVNYDVYPKTETVLAAVPIHSVTWNGRHSDVGGAEANKRWGDSFTIPSLESPLLYTTAQFTKNYTGQGISYVVKLLVENPSAQTETVPEFGIDGKSKEKIFTGKRLSKPISLEPGEKKYLFYSIDTDTDVELDSLNVLTTETFTAPDATTVTFDIGKIHIALPAPEPSPIKDDYTLGTPIVFDRWSDFVHPQLDVSLMELHKSVNDEDGNQVVLAKFQLTNRAERYVPVPAFQTELWTEDGHSYSGSRQQSAAAQVESGSSVIVSYGFTLPASEGAQHFLLKLFDDQTAASYKSEIASCGVSLQGDDDRTDLKLYPYTLNIKHLRAVPVINATATNLMNYTYKLLLDLDLQRSNQVIVDNNFSKLKIEILDAYGKSLGTKYFPFTGVNRITAGTDQEIVFDGLNVDQATDRVTVKLYESVATANGETNRLLYTLVQE